MWQLPQHKLSDVVKTPIVPMNSSTGMPFSTWMFLKTCIGHLGRYGACLDDLRGCRLSRATGWRWRLRRPASGLGRTARRLLVRGAADSGTAVPGTIVPFAGTT